MQQTVIETGAQPRPTEAESTIRYANGHRLRDVSVWRDAALLWLAQRIILLICAYFGISYLDSHHDYTRLLTGWYLWDAAIYAGIAKGGYQQLWQTAFYPMLPGLEHALAPLVGGDPSLAGLIISNVAAFLTLGLLRVLVERQFGRAVAQRTLIYLLAFPTAFFLITPYTESLFLLFSVACFLALTSRRWLLAGFMAALAALTRPVGVLLLAPILVEYLQSLPMWRGETGRFSLGSWHEHGKVLSACALPVLALVAYHLAIGPLTGSASPLESELATGWGRSLTLPGMGFARAALALAHAKDPLSATHIVLDVAFTALLVALSVLAWRRLPPAYVAYTWLSTALILVTPSHGWTALASTMRFMLVIFPLFILLGMWGRRPWLNILILTCSLLLLALQTAIYISGGWIA